MCIKCGKWCWGDELEEGQSYIVRAGEIGFPVAVINSSSLIAAIMKKQRLQVALPDLAPASVWAVEIASAEDLYRFYNRHDLPAWDRI